MEDLKKLWECVLVEFELTLSPANFTTWFKNTRIQREDEGVVYVSVPTQFTKEWLQSHYHKNILRLLRSKAEKIRAIEYVVTKEPELADQAAFSLVEESRELPLPETPNKDNGLSPKYTFENFVVGPFNELAHAAAQSAIKRPGVIYNPLFVYGNTGHGKTHLLYAIGNQIHTEDSGLKIKFVTLEKFSDDYVSAVMSGGGQNVLNFRDKYRACDVLIMDDVQFLGKKERTQDELFHLYDYMVNHQKQIILSSDKHPNYIPHLENRLKSRFSAGMTVDIQPPDQESRAAILRSKLATKKVSLAEDVVDYLAESINSNVRELEGALNTILLQTELRKKDLSLIEVKSLIKEAVRPKKAVSIKDVIKSIADFYNTEESSIYEKTRKKEVVKPRQIIMYILREDFKISFPTIGEKLGGRDHTTVIHSCEKIKEGLKSDLGLVQEIDQIRLMLK